MNSSDSKPFDPPGAPPPLNLNPIIPMKRNSTEVSTDRTESLECLYPLLSPGVLESKSSLLSGANGVLPFGNVANVSRTVSITSLGSSLYGGMLSSYQAPLMPPGHVTHTGSSKYSSSHPVSSNHTNMNTLLVCPHMAEPGFVENVPPLDKDAVSNSFDANAADNPLYQTPEVSTDFYNYISMNRRRRKKTVGMATFKYCDGELLNDSDGNYCDFFKMRSKRRDSNKSNQTSEHPTDTGLKYKSCTKQYKDNDNSMPKKSSQQSASEFKADYADDTVSGSDSDNSMDRAGTINIFPGYDNREIEANINKQSDGSYNMTSYENDNQSPSIGVDNPVLLTIASKAEDDKAEANEAETGAAKVTKHSRPPADESYDKASLAGDAVASPLCVDQPPTSQDTSRLNNPLFYCCSDVEPKAEPIRVAANNQDDNEGMEVSREMRKAAMPNYYALDDDTLQTRYASTVSSPIKPTDSYKKFLGFDRQNCNPGSFNISCNRKANLTKYSPFNTSLDDVIFSRSSNRWSISDGNSAGYKRNSSAHFFRSGSFDAVRSFHQTDSNSSHNARTSVRTGSKLPFFGSWNFSSPMTTPTTAGSNKVYGAGVYLKPIPEGNIPGAVLSSSRSPDVLGFGLSQAAPLTRFATSTHSSAVASPVAGSLPLAQAGGRGASSAAEGCSGASTPGATHPEGAQGAQGRTIPLHMPSHDSIALIS